MLTSPPLYSFSPGAPPARSTRYPPTATTARMRSARAAGSETMVAGPGCDGGREGDGVGESASGASGRGGFSVDVSSSPSSSVSATTPPAASGAAEDDPEAARDATDASTVDAERCSSLPRRGGLYRLGRPPARCTPCIS